MESQRLKNADETHSKSFYKSLNRFLTYGCYASGGLIFGIVVGLGSEYNVFLTAISAFVLGVLLAKLEIKFTEHRKSDLERALFVGVVVIVSLLVTLFLLTA